MLEDPDFPLWPQQDLPSHASGSRSAPREDQLGEQPQLGSLRKQQPQPRVHQGMLIQKRQQCRPAGIPLSAPPVEDLEDPLPNRGWPVRPPLPLLPDVGQPAQEGPARIRQGGHEEEIGGGVGDGHLQEDPEEGTLLSREGPPDPRNPKAHRQRGLPASLQQPMKGLYGRAQRLRGLLGIQPPSSARKQARRQQGNVRPPHSHVQEIGIL
jgi:hypothetical protein